jgi:TadE-like protein
MRELKARPKLQRLRQDESGQAFVELVLILPFLFITIAALIFFGRVLYAKIALDMASYDACRAAVEALLPGDGLEQGLTAGRETLSGFYMNPAGAQLTVAPDGVWGRGVWVSCNTRYNLYVGDIPLVSLFNSGRTVPLNANTWSRIETWRSWWEH